VIVVVAASVLAVQSSKLKNINSVGCNLFNRYFLLHALLSTEILP
jgi:NADH:ubiquinone oxidoreductase subunit 6 (subunit J)